MSQQLAKRANDERKYRIFGDFYVILASLASI